MVHLLRKLPRGDSCFAVDHIGRQREYWRSRRSRIFGGSSTCGRRGKAGCGGGDVRFGMRDVGDDVGDDAG